MLTSIDVSGAQVGMVSLFDVSGQNAPESSVDESALTFQAHEGEKAAKHPISSDSCKQMLLVPYHSILSFHWHSRCPGPDNSIRREMLSPFNSTPAAEHCWMTNLVPARDLTRMKFNLRHIRSFPALTMPA